MSEFFISPWPTLGGEGMMFSSRPFGRRFVFRPSFVNAFLRDAVSLHRAGQTKTGKSKNTTNEKNNKIIKGRYGSFR